MSDVAHIQGTTYHGRKGGTRNAFHYGVDYIRLDPEQEATGPWLFRRNRRGVFALWDCDHGGPPGDGHGTKWVRGVLANAPFQIGRIELLAQPRVLGHVFNPVSFWLVRDNEDILRTVIAEVTNTYGDRHSYLCHHDDFGPIVGTDTLEATKIFYVSPFQPVEGGYRFNFDITEERVAIRIDYSTGHSGLIATLAGPCQPLTSATILHSMLRRPFGSRRVLGLIHWQALKLWWKGVAFRTRPEPPDAEVSR